MGCDNYLACTAGRGNERCFQTEENVVEDYIASIDAELLFPCLGEAEFGRQKVIRRYVENGSCRDGEDFIVTIEKKTILK